MDTRLHPIQAMQEYNLRLNTDEINFLLSILGKQPYEEVFQLVGKIHEQANAQAQPDAAAPARFHARPLQPTDTPNAEDLPASGPSGNGETQSTEK